MQFQIRHENLIDFPYDPEKKKYHSLFFFDEEKVNNLVSEILFASPTCYLVSGYRGSGKTSFIQRVKEKCIELNASEKKHTAIIFVNSSFSRFESKTYFLRKIIRDFEETLLKNETPYGTENREKLKGLYNRTFNEVKKERSQLIEREGSIEIKLDAGKYIKNLLLKILPLIAPFLIDFSLKSLFVDSPQLISPVIKGLLYMASITWGLFNVIDFTGKYSIKNTTSEKTSESSLSDDNITEYELEQILNKFVQEGYKLVFVLDELDKIEQEELDKLLKEMKPWLVRGAVDFILVAGQKLTMQYYQLRDGEDEILASLFSKVIHIHQLTEQQLEKMCMELLFMNPSADIESAYQLCNSYIYRSRRIPRTFMNLLRQDLRWENGQAFLPLQNSHFKMDMGKMEVLKRIFERLSVNADIPETVKGHLIMQLFRAAALITEKNKNTILSEDLHIYILKPGKKEDGYQYGSVEPILLEYMNEFYNEAVKDGLIEVLQKLGKEGENAIVEQVKPDSIDNTDTAIAAFKYDFIAFMDIAERLWEYGYLDSKIPRESVSVSKILTKFIEEGAISFSGIESNLFSYPLKFYRERLTDNTAFIELAELFSKNTISFPFLYQQLFYYYTKRQINSVFINGFSPDNEIRELTSFERRSADFIQTDVVKDTKVLFSYKFINGSVIITSEEVDRIINILEEYNLQTQQGNYYVSIIFYKSAETIDNAVLNLSSNYLVEKARPDFKDRIKFIIIPVHQFDNLITNLESLKLSIRHYSPLPSLKQRGPQKRSKTPKKPPNSNISFTDPDDPQKGKWGGNPISNERKLGAKIRPDGSNEGWYLLSLTVESTNPQKNPLIGRVKFYLHDTFSPDQITVLAKDGIAEIKDLPTYEAFTVGATCDNNTTTLELDMNELPEAPDGFKYIS